MKILIVSQYFWPEEFRINDIAKGLKEQGHEVEILTGIPNYPKGEKIAGFSLLKRTHREFGGIKVYRTPMFVRGKSGALRLILNYLSYMLFGVLRSIPFLFKKYDKVFVFQISPITSAVPAIFISKIKKIPSYIYVQDLWPETFYSIVNIKNEKIKKVMKKICNKIYDSFTKILIASEGYRNILIKENIDNNKIEYLPQWAEDFYSNKGIVQEKDIAGEFMLTFAGNIGKAQSVETIIEAARLTKEKEPNLNIRWQIIGDGSEFEKIKKIILDYKLNGYVNLLGRKPAQAIPSYFETSDALIVTLKNEDILKVTLPAKVQSYMAARKPILSVVSGEGKKIIEEAECGLVCEAEDYQILSENAIKLYKMKLEERNILANNGYEYFNQNFTRGELLKRLEKILN